ncbi:hypothetical protein N8793_00370 [Pseudomonadales bacterium]|nr:hypothetical protein [Pseudomonadales bacterium]
METALITSCSNRKSISKKHRASSAQLVKGSLLQTAKSWKKLTKAHSPKINASELYQGRGFLEAKHAATKLNADHWIISAGLGLIKSDQKIPAYDLTVSGTGTASIKNKVLSNDFTSQAWWKEINKKGRNLADLIQKNQNKLFIIAVPNSYFHMISADLEALSVKDLKRVRIIGPTKKAIPEHYAELYLPYDTRLDGPKSPIKGTRSDFPQRSAHHFSEYIYPKAKSGTASKHALLVSEAMKRMKYPSTPERAKKTDQEILTLIKKNWKKCSGQTGKLLRIMRDEELIACEQGRFKDLVNGYRDNMARKKK